MRRFVEDIVQYDTDNTEELKLKAQLLEKCEKIGEKILERIEEGHITLSAIVLNQSADKILMVYHNIYQSFSWPGGHTDGADDFLNKIMKEVREETGIKELCPISKGIFAIDKLPVKEHIKNNCMVKAHNHYNLTYAFITSDTQKLSVKEDENSAVAWINLDEYEKVCKEPHMLPVYGKVIEKVLRYLDRKGEIYGELGERLLPWYRENARDLPWRKTKDSYEIWVSEIMLQQTRVEAVKEYYKRFLHALPTVWDLASVSEEVLLKLWEGLGYYNRVKNMQKAAKIIVQEYGGVFPQEYDAIRALPGIGDYTAAAVASICYGEKTAAVDGNVLRVIARVTEDYSDIAKQSTKKQIAAKLNQYYPKGEDGRFFNQSLMELGATVCSPAGVPKCGICPLEDICLAKAKQAFEILPQKAQKKPRKREEKTVFVLTCNGKIAIEKRSEAGLLAGLWQFPNVNGFFGIQEALKIAKEWNVAPLSIEKKITGGHIFTHIQWDMQCYYISCQREDEKFLWLSSKDIANDIALPSAFRQFFDAKTEIG